MKALFLLHKFPLPAELYWYSCVVAYTFVNTYYFIVFFLYLVDVPLDV